LRKEELYKLHCSVNYYDEVGQACRTHGRCEKCIGHSRLKVFEETDLGKYVQIGRYVLKSSLRNTIILSVLDSAC
jgi:hypothetical protein